MLMTLMLNLQTGVKGEYVRGKLVKGRGVRVVGQRCRVSGGRGATAGRADASDAEGGKKARG